jgi:hypothetical protein
MTVSDLDLRRERAARNQSLFREVNERIDELNDGGVGEVPRYVCECLDTECVEQLAIPHDEYERIRRHPTEFFVIPGHELLEVEEVVHREDRWLVVRKLGAGAKVAAEAAESSSR